MRTNATSKGPQITKLKNCKWKITKKYEPIQQGRVHKLQTNYYKREPIQLGRVHKLHKWKWNGLVLQALGHDYEDNDFKLRNTKGTSLQKFISFWQNNWFHEILQIGRPAKTIASRCAGFRSCSSRSSSSFRRYFLNNLLLLGFIAERKNILLASYGFELSFGYFKGEFAAFPIEFFSNHFLQKHQFFRHTVQFIVILGGVEFCDNLHFRISNFMKFMSTSTLLFNFRIV